MGQTVVGGDVMDDVTAWTRVAHVHVWHVRALRLPYGACARVRFDGGACTMWRTFWRRVTARAKSFGLEIFGFFRSKAVEDPCMVSFVKS